MPVEQDTDEVVDDWLELADDDPAEPSTGGAKPSTELSGGAEPSTGGAELSAELSTELDAEERSTELTAVREHAQL